MMTKKYKTLMRRDGDTFGTILNGIPYESTIPFLLPLRVEIEDLIPSINEDQVDYFKENYYLCECEITINGISREISETERS